MHYPKSLLSPLVALAVAAVLTACGGGGDSSDGGGSSSGSGDALSNTGNLAESGTNLSANRESAAIQEAGAPQASGNPAADGFNWTNYRRQQLGLSTLTRNRQIDIAAQGHSDYQKANNTITHEQTSGSPGFTGTTMADRLVAAGYTLKAPYAYGEVIAASGNLGGANAVEDLITAIYHRFVMFEPRFREAGTGSASASSGYHYFTLNLATTGGLGSGLGTGKFVTYPIANQQNVLTIFYSNYETPDPVAERNEVGYPVSIHADITSNVTVQSFTIAPRGGKPLEVKLLSHATDSNTAKSVAAIVPLSVLAAKTTYDVVFTGTVDGMAATRSWAFTTR